MKSSGKTNWKASWIWKSHNTIKNSFAYFRKEIDVREDFRNAKIFVSAHNHFKLYINGENIAGYITPAPSHPQKAKYYLVYDVTDILKTGRNAICAVAHYMGGDGQNYVNGYPGFILQCETTDKNNLTSVAAATNESWKVLNNTPYMDDAQYQQNRRISAIEIYNASAEPKGWLYPDYDDANWDNAVYSAIEKEKWKMVLQQIPEGEIEEIIIPSAVGMQKSGLQVFDAGKIVSGWPRLELRGINGTKIRMRYSENMDNSGRVGHNVANEDSETYFDEYVMCGGELERWSPDFSYKAFRYVEVTGYPEMVSPEQIKIIRAHTALEYHGSFHSSNSLFNDIYKACIDTQKNNMLGQLVDCPHREQAQYLADSDMQAETLCYNFHAKSMLEKVLSDFRDAQLKDGTFPFVFPSNFENPDFHIMIPEWDLHFCTLMWKVYWIYGDISNIAEFYSTAKGMLEYYLKLIDSNTGLVKKSVDRWHISDWPYPDINQDGRYLTVQNCKIYNALKIMANAAKLLDLEEDFLFCEIQSQMLKTAIVNHLYDADKRIFFDCFGSKESHQGTNVIAYQYGLVPEEAGDSLLERIISDGMGCRTLLSLNLFQVLFEKGKGEHAYKLLNSTDYPGWGYMISKGAKTIWEGFDDIESHCHAWNAYPARLYAEYILGVKPAAAGFREIVIKPFFAEDMDFAQGNITTVRGDIFVSWEKNSSGLKLKLGIPETISAKIYIPESLYKETSIYAISLEEDSVLVWKNGAFEGIQKKYTKMPNVNPLMIEDN